MKNNNGVEGRQILAKTGYQFIPQCCDDCRYLDYDCDDYSILFYYCEQNIWLPTKKGTCKKQEVCKRIEQGADKNVRRCT